MTTKAPKLYMNSLLTIVVVIYVTQKGPSSIESIDFENPSTINKDFTTRKTTCPLKSIILVKFRHQIITRSGT